MSSSSNFVKDLALQISSGASLAVVITHEIDRAVEKILEAGRGIEPKLHLYKYDPARGLQDLMAKGLPMMVSKLPDNKMATLREYLIESGRYEQQFPGSSLDPEVQPNEESLILANFGYTPEEALSDAVRVPGTESHPVGVIITGIDKALKENPSLMSVIQTRAKDYRTSGSVLVLVTSNPDVPNDLRRIARVVKLPLPDESDLTEALNIVTASVSADKWPSFLKDPKSEVIKACLGLTYEEAENTLAKVAARDKCLTRVAIAREKALILAQDGVLRYFEPTSTDADFGGYEVFKEGMTKFLETSTPEAIEFGCTPADGFHLTGAPGTGKTEWAKAIAKKFKMSAAILNFGALFDKYIGESEAKTTRLIDTMVAMAPIVVIFDEGEKCWPKTGEGDSGVAGRVGAQLLSFMSDPHPGIVIMLTSNDPRTLPPELSRKGRINEIYHFGLPHHGERVEIFKIHITKVKRDAEKFDLDTLSAGTEGFSGADIKELVQDGLRAAFRAKSELTTDILLKQAKETTPAATIFRERITEIDTWAKSHGVVSASKKFVARPGNEPKKRAIKY